MTNPRDLGARLCPGDWVSRLAQLLGPPEPRPDVSPERAAAQHVAQVRLLLDQIWQDAYTAGAAYALSLAPARLIIPHSSANLIEAQLEPHFSPEKQ